MSVEAPTDDKFHALRLEVRNGNERNACLIPVNIDMAHAETVHELAEKVQKFFDEFIPGVKVDGGIWGHWYGD